MDNAKRRAIERLASDVRRALNLQQVPVDVEAAIKNLGGALIYNENLEYEATIQKTGDESFQITLRDRDNEGRNRFSLAHELGHLFLHMGFAVNPELWRDARFHNDYIIARFGYSPEEYQANNFAAEFLMPKEEFRQYYAEVDGNLERIADNFRVTQDAARTRAKWLGLLGWE